MDSNSRHPIFNQTQSMQTGSQYSQSENSPYSTYPRSTKLYTVSTLSPKPSLDYQISVARQGRGFFWEVFIVLIVIFLSLLAILQILFDLNQLTAWPWISCINGSSLVNPVTLNLTVCTNVSFNQSVPASYCISSPSLHLNSSSGSLSLLSSPLLLNASYSTACQLGAPWTWLTPAWLLQFVALALHALFLLELLFRSCLTRCRCTHCDALEISDALVVVVCCACAYVASALVAFVFSSAALACLVRDALNLLPLLRLMRVVRVTRTQRNVLRALQDECDARLRAEDKLRQLERERVKNCGTGGALSKQLLQQQQQREARPSQSSVQPQIKATLAKRTPLQTTIAITASSMTASTGRPPLAVQAACQPSLTSNQPVLKVIDPQIQKRPSLQTLSTSPSTSQGPTPSSSASKSAISSSSSANSARPLLPLTSRPIGVSPLITTSPISSMPDCITYASPSTSRPSISGAANPAYSPVKELTQTSQAPTRDANANATAVEMKALARKASSGVRQRPQQLITNSTSVASPPSAVDSRNNRTSTLTEEQQQMQALHELDDVLSQHSATGGSPSRSRRTSAAEALAALDGVLAGHRSSSPTPSESEAFRALDDVLALDEGAEDDKRTGVANARATRSKQKNEVENMSAGGSREVDAGAGSGSATTTTLEEQQRRPHASTSHSRPDARGGAARAIERAESHTRKSSAPASADHQPTRRP